MFLTCDRGRKSIFLGSFNFYNDLVEQRCFLVCHPVVSGKFGFNLFKCSTTSDFRGVDAQTVCMPFGLFFVDFIKTGSESIYVIE